TLSDYADFPLLNFLIQVEDELILVTSRTSSTLTCTRAYGGTSLDTHPAAEPVYLIWTFGGIVHTKTKTKGGSQFECLDFLDALEGIPVTATYPGAGTNDTDVEILTDVLTLQKTPLPLQLVSTGVTPTAFRELVYENTSIKNVLDQFCTYTGNKYTCYQNWWDGSPKLCYFDPTLGASGIALAAGDIYADWSIEKSRATLANKVVITTALADVPTDNAWVDDDITDHELGWGQYDYNSVIAATYLKVGTTANGKLGFRISVPRDCTLGKVRVVAAKVGNGADLYLFIRKSDGTVTYHNLVDAATLTTSYVLYDVAPGAGVYTPYLKQGLNYVWLHANDYSSDSHYIKIAAVHCGDNLDVDIGVEESLLNTSVLSGDVAHTQIWEPGAIHLIDNLSGVCVPALQLTTAATITSNWTVPAGGSLREAGPGGLLLLGGPKKSTLIYTHPIFPVISDDEYPTFRLRMKGGLKSGDISYSLVMVYIYHDDSNYLSKDVRVSNDERDYDLALAGFAETGTMDYHNITKIGIKPDVIARVVKELAFLGSSYAKSLDDANSQAVYEVKAYSEDVPFQTKAEVDVFAAALLAARKDPQSSITVRCKYLYPVELFYYVTMTLDGDSITPTVIGYDIDPVKEETKFIFNALSAHDFARWMVAIRIDPLTG
ncbi:MAG: hypothetical protein WCP58_07930, partial [bacterium]